ncbi:MAG: tRNA (N6-isopentenyl adenosine(37)-C2)-methylthiotransferase MiaB [Cytophagales bacterium]
MSEVIGDIGILEQENEACETVKTSIEEDRGNSRKLYIESYGCQMNFSDSEIVTSILKNEGFDTTSKYEEADLILLNTCSIRDKAEQTIRKRLKQFNAIKRNKPKTQIAVLGCMAERLKKNLLEEEKIVDIVAGPDSYRDLPNLVKQVDEGDKAVNVFLSREETYADISPVRLNSNGVTAFVSIMRGCDNMCSFCVVPFTRGRERSRNPESILKEAQELIANGYKEVTLLGQNVDSYKWKNEDNGEILNFAQLLEKVALLSPELRIRFSTSHPKDITDEVLHTIARYENICNYIHLPAQSGNDRILQLMNRTYSREWYLERVSAIRRIIGDECGISSDMITGFCSETEEEHQDTLSLMKEVKYDFSYMFFYSERPGTLAAKKYSDDISLEVKKRRLAEIIALQSELSLERNKKDLTKVHKVLVEGLSKKSDRELYGRNSANKVVVFPKENYKIGQYVNVMVNDCSSATLLGKAVEAV